MSRYRCTTPISRVNGRPYAPISSTRLRNLIVYSNEFPRGSRI